MRPGSDKAYSSMLLGGVGLILGGSVVGLLLFIFGALRGRSGSGAMYGACACLLLIVVGLVMVGGTLFAGLRRSSSAPKQAFRCDNCRVVARYLIIPGGEMSFEVDSVFLDDPGTKLYVRLLVPGLGTHEYRAPGAVWNQCGEGMVGTAIFQGEWLGQFIPTIGVA